MVAIFVGAGSGFERSSANLLGGAGQLGGGLIGRAGENVSVNAFSGNLIVSQQDEYLVGRGPDVGISRTYNSIASAADGDNGDQWQQSTHRRVFGLTGTLGTAGSTISRLGGDGAVLVYSWDAAAGAYISKEGAGAHDRLSHSGGEWTGDEEAARTQFEKTLEVDPNFAESYGSIAVLDAISGDLESAKRNSDVALRLDRQCFSAALASALIAAAREDGETARRILELAVNRPIGGDGPTIAEALARLGR